MSFHYQLSTLDSSNSSRNMGCYTPPPPHALNETSPNTSGTSFQCHQVSFNSCSGTPPQYRGRNSSNGVETPRNGNFSGFGGVHHNRSNSGHLEAHSHFNVGAAQRHHTPMQHNPFGNVSASLMCTPQTSRQELDLRATVDREVMEVNAASRRQFPQLLTQLDENVFLGGFPCEDAIELLHQNDITHCVNVSDGPAFNHDSFATFQIETRDEPDYYILDNHLDDFANLVDDILSSDCAAKVYVHCVAGVNRSVTLMIGYLMQRRGFQLLDAIRHFRDCGKNVILDNAGFRSQLVQFALANGEEPSFAPCY